MKIPMTRWVERWNAYWFPETSTLYLSISRIVIVATQLFWLSRPLALHLNLIEKNREFIDPQFLMSAVAAVLPSDVFFTRSAFTAFYWVIAVAGFAALIGLFTRTSLLVFALGTWILTAHAYSFGDRHHPEAVFAIVLLALAFAPSGGSLSLDALLRRRGRRSVEGPEIVDTAMWPLKLAHVLLALIYFSTGMSKLVLGGPRWLNGYTLQSHTFWDAINRDIPLGIWLGQQHALAIVLSVFTVLLETFFVVSLLVPRTAPFIFIAAFFFQLGLLLTAGHVFYQHMVLLVLLLLFIRPEWWRSWWDKHVGRAATAEPAHPAAMSPG
jgi:vitamin K-dependent gamma-carboxylase-like protein